VSALSESHEKIRVIFYDVSLYDDLKIKESAVRANKNTVLKLSI